jgi:REP element-mobilizing transposase RayT
MSQRKITFSLNEYYHLYNRGNSKQIIYKDRSDYKRFQYALYIANSQKSFTFRELGELDVFDFEREEQLVYIGAYCLMPNHFHILLKPAIEQGVQLFMQKLSTSYSMYFNQRYERTGGLFEGRFKSQWVDSDEYLKYLFSYIHLNPVKLIQFDWKEVGIHNLQKTKQYLSAYPFSSLFDYLSPQRRREQLIINPGQFPEYFRSDISGTSEKKILLELIEWLSYKENIMPEAGPM